MSGPPDALRQALALHARGDLAGALAAGETALKAAPRHPGLLQFLGVVAAQAGNAAKAADYLARSLAADPANQRTRANLAKLRLDAGEAAEAERLTAPAAVPAPAPDLLRLRGDILKNLGRSAEAVAAYEAAVAAQPDFAEAWNNLGNARRERSDLSGAIAALDRARRLAPDLAAAHLSLARVLIEAGRGGEALAVLDARLAAAPADNAALAEKGIALTRLGRAAEALAPLAEALRRSPRDWAAQLALGDAHGQLEDIASAERAYRAAITLRPAAGLPYVNLGLLLEQHNRLADLAALAPAARAAGVPEGETAMLRILEDQRAGRHAEALAAARALDVAGTGLDLARARLIGQLADKLGHHAEAFAAFAEVNALAAAPYLAAGHRIADYREAVERQIAAATADWAARWTPHAPAGRPSPAFLVGFPRSGTTLLDTVLMGHKDTLVLEEEPLLQRVAERAGGMERLPDLPPAEIDALRALYFRELDALAPDAGNRLVIDKLPLHLVRTPLIHRLFPDAKFIFAERHPCDAVLSCFMQNFRINAAMASFLTLEDSALLYDRVMSFWFRCRELLPLDVHAVRYETMIADLEGTARALLDYLGLSWSGAVLDHQATAASRAHIRTPSYSQIVQPLYRSADGRWTKYRAEMAPVLPILAPWAGRFGYPM
ncbi:MAG: sulfotransferase [Alphaproteobacteria bacterium]